MLLYLPLLILSGWFLYKFITGLSSLSSPGEVFEKGLGLFIGIGVAWLVFRIASLMRDKDLLK